MSPLRWRPVAAVCLLVPLALAPPGARAQIPIESREGIALQNQIAELRHQIEALQGQVSSGGGGGVLSGSPPPAAPPGASGDLIASLLSRVQALEDETRSLRGRLDEMQNTQQHQYEDLNKQIGDLNFKLGGGGGGSPAAASPPAAAYGSPPPYTPPAYSPPPPQPGGRAAAAAPGGPRAPERAIAEGYADLGRRDYAGAAAAAREVLDNNRTSPRAYDAQYLLAQALSGKRDYAQAAIAYDDTYNRARTGTHAPDALVGLASSLNAIGERKAACETLAKLAREFPKVRPDVHNAAGAVRVRAGCS